jgi:hypothetical protein
MSAWITEGARVSALLPTLDGSISGEFTELVKW